MNIIVCVKRVPDTAADKNLDPDSLTLDRDGVESIVNPVDEFAIEAALLLREAGGGEVTVLTMGPEPAEKQAVRKALALGVDAAVMVTDDRLAGSDAIATARVLAAAVSRRDFDLVILGSESTDARTSLVPQALAQFLGLPGMTNAKRVEVADGSVTIHREREGGHDVVRARLPAVVSVVKGTNEPRYANLKGIMAAKQKPLEVLSGDDLGLGEDVGLAGSGTEILEASAVPRRTGGAILEDDGEAHVKLADFLQERKLI